MTNQPDPPKKPPSERRQDAARIKKKARELADMPIVEVVTGDGTVVKPVTSAHLSGAARALQLAYEIEDKADELDRLAAAPPTVYQRTLEGQAVEASYGNGKPGVSQMVKAEREFFKIIEANPSLYPWSDLFIKYRQQFTGKEGFRQAACVAWAKYPKELRVPASKEEFADLMGCTVRTIDHQLAKPHVKAAILQESMGPWEKLRQRVEDNVLPKVVDVAEDDTHKHWPFAVEMSAGALGYMPAKGPQVVAQATAGAVAEGGKTVVVKVLKGVSMDDL